MTIQMAVFLTTALCISSITDLKSQRIPNALTFPVIILAFAYHGVTQGADGLLFALSGLGLGLGVMLLPYLGGYMGAGDVKLMMAVGACLGTNLLFAAFLYSCLAGGVYALIVLAPRRELFRRVVRNVWGAAKVHAALGTVAGVGIRTESDAPRLCYGVAISIGTILAMGLEAHRIGLIRGL